MAVSINAAEEETVAPRAEASRSRESCRLGGGWLHRDPLGWGKDQTEAQGW